MWCWLDFLFPKCQTHAYTRFENGCSENSTQKPLTSTLRKKKINTLFAGLGRSVLGKAVPSVLSTQDLWHSFSQYGPPGRQITYMYGSREGPVRKYFLNGRKSFKLNPTNFIKSRLVILDRMQIWLLINYSFIFVLISLTSLGSMREIQNKFHRRMRLVSLISIYI